MKRSAAIIVAAFLAFACAPPARAQLANPGPLTLGAFQIGAAGNYPGLPVANLQGITALSCQARFYYGSGGTQVNVYLQTSLDQGNSWFDISNIEFTTASGIEVVNLSGLNAVTTPTAPVNLALLNNTSFNGPLGDRLQAVVVSTGTYGSNTLAAVNCVAR